ncbi:MAG: LPS assembly lipoprotein LptE [Gammaproteobacteria bacterium]
MKRAQLAVLLVAIIVTPACGFHMQGRAEYAPELKSLYVVIPDQSTDLAKQLKRSLHISDLDLAVSENAATAVLQIMTDDSGRKVESVSARNRPQEYRVFYTAVYRVTAGSEVLLAPQTITRTRIYTYDELQVLAKDHEESLLREAMAREIAGVITRRLADIEIPVT